MFLYIVERSMVGQQFAERYASACGTGTTQ